LTPFRGGALARLRTFGHGEKLMTVLLFDFLIAAAVGIAAAAIIAFILANMVIGWFKRANGKH
jgi:hypothetical protein